MFRIALITVLGLALAGCQKEPPEEQALSTEGAAPANTPANTPIEPRWYTRKQVRAGAPLYQAHCATCHKENAEGTPDWRRRDAKGQLPPPPLNGTAHAWHHPMQILRTVVRRGGAPVGGSMPAFEDKLDAQQIDAILAWVQSHWNDDIYGHWRERDRQSR